ncbi:MAG TPA: glutathione S-transferase [Candidatus Limnocylindrales bacterium]|nr:glutathione S-transferase [Candidatus Limnocylindrales bacterium]
MSETIELLQFPFSHYNEKVRWTLDYKRIAHVRINYLPGPHAPQIKKLTGQTAVPVVRTDGKVVAGSARIIDMIERSHPSPPLYPADAADREEALAIQQRFDDELGPAVRRLVFKALLDDEPDYIPRMFSVGKPEWKRALYRGMFPLVQGLLRKANGVTSEQVAVAEKTVESLLDFIAGKTSRTGQMVGDGFTIADLTGAALLAPMVAVTHPDMAKPEPLPKAARVLLQRYERHPAVLWVHEQYRKHRPPSCGTVVA